jgi:hypothetical protein
VPVRPLLLPVLLVLIPRKCRTSSPLLPARLDTADVFVPKLNSCGLPKKRDTPSLDILRIMHMHMAEEATTMRARLRLMLLQEL